MNKKVKQFIERFKAKVTGKPTPDPKTFVRTNVYSQPHVLQHYMTGEALSHDEKVVADLSPVRLEIGYGHTWIYFCPMQDIQIKSKLQLGDGREIPTELVVTNDLKAPEDLRSGLYTLKNVILHSNGTISVTGTPQTKWEPVHYH